MTRPYSPTDLSSPLIRLLGRPVRAGEHEGILGDVHEDGMATIERDGFVVAVVPADSVEVKV